jgi:hypothetical protein
MRAVILLQHLSVLLDIIALALLLRQLAHVDFSQIPLDCFGKKALVRLGRLVACWLICASRL